MIKLFFLLLVCFYTISSFAAKVQSQIHSIDKGKNGEVHIVKIMSGDVAFIEYGDKSLLEQIEAHLADDSWLEFNLGKQNSLLSIREIQPGPRRNFTPRTRDPEPYVPSVVTSATASSIFSKMRRNYRDKSQCFNRAHVWTYEEYARSKTNMNKIFLFFTSRYIRTYRFHWWFHVTPMVHVGGTKPINWRALDRRYTSGPLTTKTWTDIFIRSKKTCKIAYKYSDYRDHQTTQDCYMIPVSMYYVVPSDIERLERTGEERIIYEYEEVEYAYWDGFGMANDPDDDGAF